MASILTHPLRFFSLSELGELSGEWEAHCGRALPSTRSPVLRLHRAQFSNRPLLRAASTRRGSTDVAPPKPPSSFITSSIQWLSALPQLQRTTDFCLVEWDVVILLLTYHSLNYKPFLLSELPDSLLSLPMCAHSQTEEGQALEKCSIEASVGLVTYLGHQEFPQHVCSTT